MSAELASAVHLRKFSLSFLTLGMAEESVTGAGHLRKNLAPRLVFLLLWQTV